MPGKKKSEKLELATAALVKCSSGDSISDDELTAGITVLRDIIQVLSNGGNEYILTCKELRHRLYSLEGFQSARKKKDYDWS